MSATATSQSRLMRCCITLLSRSMRHSRGVADVQRAWVTAGAIATTLIAAAPATQAHKPITSPFTYSRDVLPIVRERCGQCHAPGGVAPMSLLTHNDAVPWGESLRLELTAGHMPPWSVDCGAAHFRAPGNLSAREVNVILTWAPGGTPAGGLKPGTPSRPSKTPRS